MATMRDVIRSAVEKLPGQMLRALKDEPNVDRYYTHDKDHGVCVYVVPLCLSAVIDKAITDYLGPPKVNVDVPFHTTDSN